MRFVVESAYLDLVYTGTYAIEQRKFGQAFRREAAPLPKSRPHTAQQQSNNSAARFIVNILSLTGLTLLMGFGVVSVRWWLS